MPAHVLDYVRPTRQREVEHRWAERLHAESVQSKGRGVVAGGDVVNAREQRPIHRDIHTGDKPPRRHGGRHDRQHVGLPRH